MDVPGFLLREQVTVAVWGGSGYGTPATVRCAIQRTADQTKLVARLDAPATPGSVITLPDGRLMLAAAVLRHNGGPATPNHVEILCPVAGYLTDPASLLRQTATDQDAYGNTTRTSAEVALAGAHLDPGPSTEDTNRRDMAVATGELLIPLGAAVAATDQIVVAGATWDVTGPARPWRPCGHDAGLLLPLRRATG